MTSAALGASVHSGWAAVVGVCEAGGELCILIRERIILVRDREAKQPYHAVENLPIAEAAEHLAAWAASAEQLAHQAVERIVTGLSRDRHVAGLGILESAGRKGTALATILASHALIHTADGDHFRNAISAGASRCGLPVLRVTARELDARASTALRKSAETMHEVVKKAGRDVGPPWGADQKAAALLAWLVLAQAPSR